MVWRSQRSIGSADCRDIMAIEIERKFLVRNTDWRAQSQSVVHIRQAYLANTDKCSIRVRIVADDKAWITLKSSQVGITRSEFEYEVPVSEAGELLLLRQSAMIDKNRHFVPIGDIVWEVDEFQGDNAGLVIAEVELASADQTIDRPAWLGDEVTNDRRYFNSQLARRPYPSWSDGN